MIPLTPTERRIVDVLLDGDHHTEAELLAAIDDQADLNNLRCHLSNIRKKINPTGHDIVPARNGHGSKVKYRLARLIRPDHI